jgi:phosphatidylglycerophosphate synthase
VGLSGGASPRTIGSSMTSAQPIRRTTEIEEITNQYFVHPIAIRLVPLFAKAHVTPNAVSVAGMLFGIAAGLAYYRYRDFEWTLVGFLLMLAWHVMDGADGQLARFTHSHSHLGKILDGIADIVTFVAVYTGLAVALSRSYGVGIYGLAFLAGACHAVQSASYELERQEYESLGWGRKAPAARQPDTTDARVVDPLFERLERLFYARLSFPVAGITAKLRDAMAAALQRQPERAALIRQCYRETFAPVLRQWSVLSANYRTLGIFLAALLKAPRYYFGFEIVGFSAILVWLIRRQSARYGMFLGAIEKLGSDSCRDPG